jgi:hypothetical protein
MRFSESFLEDLRDRIPISDVIGTRVTWDRKKTKVSRGDFWACCPVHGENSPSFHCEDRKGRYHCFGCGISGDHFRFFTELDGVSFPRAVEMVASLAGVSLPDASPETEAERRARAKRDAEFAKRKLDQEAQRRREEAEKIETVKDIWSEGIPIAGTLAEKYLLGRGVFPMAWPLSLRFHPGVRFNPLDITSRRAPALICGVQDRTRKLVAVWRIFLTKEGNALTGDDGRKVKLGFGPAGGGAVRLGPQGPEILVCEGVETGFGVGCLTGWKKPVWPLLSTSGMIGWEPPEGVTKVQIYSDGDRHKVRKDGVVGDPPGRVAAESLREKLVARGTDVTVHEPPAGTDWLDVWNGLQAEEVRERDVEYDRG